jgi:hypothetical protein
MNLFESLNSNIMRKIPYVMFVLLTGILVCFSCAPEEEVVPQDDLSLILKSPQNGLLKQALKFEAVHQVPIPLGGTIPAMPPPDITPGNGNRFYLTAPAMTKFTNATPSDAAVLLVDGILEAQLEAFWKVPNNDPTFIMMGTGPAKGEFVIERASEIVWKGTITGVRKNVGTNEYGQPLFQWRGHIKAVGMGDYEGLKLTATETTDPSPMPAMVYYWSGVITP